MKRDKLGFPILAQPEEGYRYSIDAYLLAGFASRFVAKNWCDLGTGCGIIAFLLARFFRGSSGWAIERQEGLHGFARKNLAGTGVTVVRGDIREFPFHRHQFDLLVCNPPYYEKGDGRINRHRETALARHCFHGNLLSFFQKSSVSLGSQGVFCFILPTWIWQKQRAQLVPPPWRILALMDVRSFVHRAPNLVCVALKQNGCTDTETSQLVLYSEHRKFTGQAKAFLMPVLKNHSDNGNVSLNKLFLPPVPGLS